MLATLIQSLVRKKYPKANLFIWGRDLSKARSIATNKNHVCNSIQELLAQSDLVITATASTSPIVNNCDVLGKKHIIAIGADDIHKHECEPLLFQKADLVIVDSLIQSSKFGDVFHAIQLGFITIDRIIELGTILQKKIKLDAQLIITDLTGIAAQDVAISEFVIKKL